MRRMVGGNMKPSGAIGTAHPDLVVLGFGIAVGMADDANNSFSHMSGREQPLYQLSSTPSGAQVMQV